MRNLVKKNENKNMDMCFFIPCNVKIELLVCSSFEIEYAIHNEPGTNE